MIKTWKHKGLERFYKTDSKSGIQAAQKNKIKTILQLLDAAMSAEDLNLPNLHLHKLKGKEKGFHAVTVQANWRIVFKFDGKDATLVDYVDYH